MSDRLEEFVNNSRQEFNLDEAPAHLWKGIDKRLNRNFRRNRNIRLLQRAAVIIVLVSTGYFISEYVHHSRAIRAGIAKNAEVKLPSEVKETEIYYTNLLNQKMDELKPVFTNYPDLKQEVNRDFSELDSICVQLKSDLKDNVSNQEVIEAMIQNYRTKIYILENLLTGLKNNNESNRKKNEKTNI